MTAEYDPIEILQQGGCNGGRHAFLAEDGTAARSQDARYYRRAHLA